MEEAERERLEETLAAVTLTFAKRAEVLSGFDSEAKIAIASNACWQATGSSPDRKSGF